MGGVSIGKVGPMSVLGRHVKEPYEMSMALEPDRRSNFFFSPPAHLCVVTYMTEILSIVTLNNQYNSTKFIYYINIFAEVENLCQPIKIWRSLAKMGQFQK